MPKVIRLSSSALRDSATRLLPHIRVPDQRRLESLLELFSTETELPLSHILRTLFPGKTTQDQLAHFRVFRSRLASAAEEAGIRLKLVVDSRKRSPPNQRRCWFEGDDLAETEVKKLTLAQESVRPLVSQKGVELEEGKEVLRYFVMWSLAPEPHRLGTDLLERLRVHFESCKRFTFRQWSAENIDVGVPWHREIQRAIEECDFGLLLLGPEFLASRYIRKHELPHFVASDSPDAAGTRIAIPVALKGFLLDADRVELSGLQHRQIFFRHRTRGLPTAFDQERSAADKSEFALRLFERILRRFESVVPRSDAASVSEESVPAARKKKLNPSELRTFAQQRLESHSTAWSRYEESIGSAVPPCNGNAPIAPEGIPSDLNGAVSEGADDARRVAAFEYLHKWVNESGGAHYCALLGEVGIGKTTTCREWARQLIQRRGSDSRVPLPIYLDLRALATEAIAKERDASTLETYLEVLIRKTWQGGELKPAVTPQNIVDLVQTAGAVVLYDGLDEILVHKTPLEGQDFVRELLRILPPSLLEGPTIPDGPRRGRVLISCRTHYFRTLRDQTNFMLGQHREPLRSQHYRAFLLLPFTDTQIEQYLSQLTTSADVERYLELIGSVHNLKECARRPLLLRLIAEQLPALEQRRAGGEPVNGAVIYDGFVSSWLERDEGKHRILPEHKRRIMEYLAATLWRSGRRGLPVVDLEQWLLEFMEAHSKLGLHYRQKPIELLKEDLRTATFLVRESEDTFQFAHTSLQEFFLAHYLRRGLIEEDWQAWATLHPSVETLTFLGQLLQICPALLREKALASLRELRDRPHGDSSVLAFRYGLHVLEQGFPSPPLAGFRLEGADLRNLTVKGAPGAPRLNLNKVSWVGARLENATFSSVSLEGCDFEQTTLDLAQFHNCRLNAASFKRARLSGVIFRLCDLTETDFERTQCYCSQWIRCQLAGAQQLPAVPPQAYFAACDAAPASLEIPPPLGFEVLDGHWREVTGVSFSPDGRQVLSGSADGTLKLWEVTSRECLRSFSGHESGVNSVAFSADGRQVLSGSDDGTLKLWEVASGECLRSFTGHNNWVRSVAFSADGRQVLSGSADRTLKLWEVSSGECLRSFSGHESGVNSVAFSADGRQVLSGSDDRTLKLWEVSSGECLRSFSGHNNWVNSVAFSADGRQVLSGSADRTLKLWEVASGQCLRSFSGHHNWLTSVVFSADGCQVLSGSGDGTLKLWEVSSGECLGSFSGHESGVRSVAFSADGRQVLSGSEDCELKLWEVASGQCLRGFSGHNNWVMSVVFSADGRQVLSGSIDGTLKLWEVASGQCLRSFSGHNNWVMSVAFSADGRQVLSGSADGKLKLWEVASGQCLRSFSAHSDWVMSVAFSADGHQVLSGSDDRTLKLWEVASGECLRSFSGHESGVRSVVFSADGRQVLSGSADGTLKLWEVASGKCLCNFAGQESWANSVAVSPDGNSVVMAGPLGLRVWSISANFNLKAELRIHLFRGGDSASWHPESSKSPRWTGEGWRWLGWRVRDPETGFIDRYPIETFDSSLKRAVLGLRSQEIPPETGVSPDSRSVTLPG